MGMTETSAQAPRYCDDNWFSYQVWDATYNGFKVVLVDRKSYPSRLNAVASLQAQGYRNVQSAPFPS